MIPLPLHSLAIKLFLILRNIGTILFTTIFYREQEKINKKKKYNIDF